jgi:glycosyltransferase involved in cell wall biosynthesis
MTSARPMRSSVIIPCYNAEAYLQSALESIFAQRRVPAEVILVDDGSTDGSAAIATRFGSSIRYHFQPHAGEGSARNHGLRLATGDYIAFLDADDLWPDTAFAALLRALEANCAFDLVYGFVEQFISPELDEAARAGLHCPAGAEAARLCGSTLFRRRAFDQVGGFDVSFKLGTAVDWIARFEERGLVAGQVGEVVLRRRLHKTNVGIVEKGNRSDYLRILRASLDRRRQGFSSSPAAK